MEIKERMTGKAVLTVDTPRTARVMKSGSLDVLATPILSALMEEAACAAIAEALDEGMTTVGGSISLVHKAPTLPGDTVTATAVVTGVKGKKITFTIRAEDSAGEVGTADHTRFIVEADHFMDNAGKRKNKE